MDDSENSAILEKVLRTKSIKWEDGKVIMWGINGLFSPMFSSVYLQRVIEEKSSHKQAMEFFYWQGKFQGHQGAKMTNQKFGYVKTIPDKINLLKFSTDQSQLTGLGKFKWVRANFEDDIFICSGNSVFAEDYKKYAGLSQFSVDYFIRGQVAAMVESVHGKKVLCVETHCIAKGDSECVFVAKPYDSWDKSNQDYKDQYVDDFPDLEELKLKPKNVK